MKKAAHKVIERIVRLAGSPEKAKTTQSALYDLMGLGLTKFEICDAICDWINRGEPVQEVVTKYAKDHIGEPAYVMKPNLTGVRLYIKVTIQECNAIETLLIISAHIDR